MPRVWVWIQLIIGWLPVGALFTVMIMSAHRAPLGEALPIALRMMISAALLGVLVHRLSARLPWPYPFRLRFIGIHLLAAAAYATAWLLLNSLIESLIQRRWGIILGPGLMPYLITGSWLYVMVAGVAYAARAAERSAQLEAMEARTQLAALRAQLHPHFLFNALHSVVQLIGIDPRAAIRAAEQLADTLRVAIEEERDVLPLADEWAFVSRYLAIETIRFGERLLVQVDIDPPAMTALLPSFALQSLVENAVRHAAAPRIDPTTLKVRASLLNDALQIEVADDGDGADLQQLDATGGSGLRRLRERLNWLYGGSSELALSTAPGQGFRASLRIPLSRAAESASD